MTGEELHNDNEDQAISRLLEHLEDLHLDQGRQSGTTSLVESGAEASLYREYLELFGMLPYALEEAVPASSTKDQILGHIRAGLVDNADTSHPQRDVGDLTLVGTTRRTSQATGVDERTLFHAAAPSQAAGVAAQQTPAQASGKAPTESSNVHPFPASAPLKPWLYAMAAMLGLCLLGMSFMAGRLSELTRATHELQGAVQQVAQTSPVQNQPTQVELLRIRDRFNMITTVARQAYPMRPPQPVDTDHAATGTIFVCGAHQQWYLNLHGLESPPPQKQYNLWFLTEEGTIHGGVLEVGASSSAELEASTMPKGTHGFAVTLEKQGQTNNEPEGPYVLLGENAVSL